VGLAVGTEGRGVDAAGVDDGKGGIVAALLMVGLSAVRISSKLSCHGLAVLEKGFFEVEATVLHSSWANCRASRRVGAFVAMSRGGCAWACPFY